MTYTTISASADKITAAATDAFHHPLGRLAQIIAAMVITAMVCVAMIDFIFEAFSKYKDYVIVGPVLAVIYMLTAITAAYEINQPQTRHGRNVATMSYIAGFGISVAYMFSVAGVNTPIAMISNVNHTIASLF